MTPDKIKELSLTNIEKLRTRIGAEALEHIPDLIQKYLNGIPMLLHHDTRKENDASIVRDGYIYSNDSLLEQKKKFSGGQTSTPEKLQAVWSRGLKYEADKCTNWVYFHLHMGEGSELHEGYNFEIKNVPDNAWMGFRDPYLMTILDRGEDADHYFSMSFDERDVYASEHILEAITCRSLNYIRTAINHMEVSQDFKQRKLSWVDLSNEPEDLIASMTQLMKAGQDGREYFLKGGNHYRNHYIERPGTSLNYPRPLPNEIFASPQFDQLFGMALKMTYEDMANLGQFTLHDKVAVSEALLKRGEKVEKVADLISANRQQEASPTAP